MEKNKGHSKIPILNNPITMLEIVKVITFSMIYYNRTNNIEGLM